MDKEQLIKDNFGKRAAEYRKSTTHGNSEDLERMASMLGDGVSKALDVATGAGHTAIKLAKFADRVTAIDITEEMLKEAGQLAIETGVSNIEFVQMDVHDMAFDDNSFDIVTSRFAPHHFSDIMKAVGEMVRVLKPGGRLYILDCSVVDGDLTEQVINHIEHLRDSSHRCSYAPRHWQRILEQFPVETEKLELLTSEYKLPLWFDRMGTSEKNRDEIFMYLDSLTPTLKRYYPYTSEFMTTYRIEILAAKK